MARRLMICLGVALMILAAGCAPKRQLVGGEPAPAPAQVAAQPAAGATGGDVDPAEEALLAEAEDQETAGQADQPLDMIEPLNRIIFNFNHVLYIHALDPLARGYKTVVPTDMRTGFRNFFNNLLFPVRFVSCLLQGKIDRAGQEMGRFIVNSTIGVLGMGDPAKDLMDVPAPPAEDLGQVLAYWGVWDGPYLVIPVLGPRTLSDAAGTLGDAFLSPTYYYPDGFWEKAAVNSFDYFNRYSFHEGEYAELVAGALDPYLAVRNAYYQNRAAQVAK